MDIGADRALQKATHAGNDLVEVDRLGPHRLLPRKGQQLGGQSRAAFGPGLGRGEQARGARVAPAEPRLEQFEIADDRGQQIVEVMCHARGQLAHRLDPLCLAQLRLGPLAVLDLGGEPAVGGFELGGALGDPALQQLVGLAHVVDVDRSAEPILDAALKADRPVVDAMPAIGAVTAAHPHLDGVFLARRDALSARGFESRLVLRVM